MPMSTRLEEAFNAQLTREFASELAYLQMAAHCEHVGFPGFAHWLRIQADEERDHAMRIFDHLLERGNLIALDAVNKPNHEFTSILDLFQKAYENERTLSTHIKDIYRLVMEEQDYASIPLLQWFVAEQVEEENLFEQLTRQLTLIGDDGHGVLMLDRELGSRQPNDANPPV